MARFLTIIMVGAMAAALTACGGRQSFRSAYGQNQIDLGLYRVENQIDMEEALALRSARHDELWVKANVVIRQLRDGKKEKDFFTAKAMYRAPDSLRMAGSRVPIGTIFDLLVLGEDVWMTFPREGQTFEGSLFDLSQKLSAIGGLGPQQFVSAVLVNQELQDRFAKGGPYKVIPKGEKHLLIAMREPDTGRQYFWLVRRADALVEEILVRTPRGEEEVRVRYLEYRMVRQEETGFEEPFPYEFVIEVPRETAKVEVDVSEYRLGRSLPEQAFRKATAREVYPLRSLQFEEGK